MIGFGLLEVRDFGPIERADLPLADRGLVLIRAENHDTDAADSNGSGKTHLFHALSWVLFGELAGEDTPAEEIVREGAKAAQVTLTFTDGDHEYRVKRRRTPSSSKLELFTDGSSTTERTKAETQARIVEILGLDWQAFRNTVLYGQGDVRRFADADTTDADRKRVLKQILRLERIDGALKRVRQELKNLRGDRAKATADLQAVEARVDAIRRELQRAEGDAETWNAAHAGAVANFENVIHTLDTNTAEDRKTAARFSRLDALTVAIGVRLEARDALYTILEEKEEAYRQADKARRIALAIHPAAALLLRERNAELNELDGLDVCPTCRTPLDGSDAAVAHVDELRRRAVEAADEVERLDRKDETAAEDLADLADEGALARAAAEGEDAWVDKARTLAGHLTAAKEAAGRVAVIDARREGLMAQLEERRARANPYTQTADRLRGEVESGDEEVEKAKAAVTAIEAKEPALRFWEEAFSDRGLPSLALDSVVPFITEAANRYLRFLTDGDITVEIVTQTEQKTTGPKEAIDFQMMIEGCSIPRPSGGQRKKLSVAIDLALMDLVATREGAQIDLILLDEVLDGLDPEGKARVVHLLQHLREVRSSIFVISHDTAIAEHFEEVVTVVKKDGKANLVTA